MTYVSRNTRIIISRWLDECDAEYRLRACRKRSDGRLKKYGSADDFRAWVNDNCVKHEYLLDLMSEGEFSDKPPFRLYGRFIPVPVLFELLQNSKTKELNSKNKYGDTRRSKSETRKETKEQSDGNLIRVQWEKNQLQKNLLKCTCLLDRVFEKLENIDCIINDTIENARRGEVQESFYSAKASCTCTQVSRPGSEISTKTYNKNTKSSDKRGELLRKISDLREKLKKVQEHRQEINHQLRRSRRKADCAPSAQVTELYSREEGNVNKLQKRLEKLISEKGRLLYEMCQALICLNSLKKPSKCSVRKKSLESLGKYEDFGRESFSDPGKSLGQHISLQQKNCESSVSESSFFDNDAKTDLEKTKEEEDSVSLDCQTFVGSVGCYEGKDDLNSVPTQSRSPSTRFIKEKSSNSSKRTIEGSRKKSKVYFQLFESPCQKKLNAENLSDFENTLSKEQQEVISSILKNIEQDRPNTTPTTKREYDAASTSQKSSNNCSINRQVKSETNMQLIEKTLRNYENRLCNFKELERKIEEMKEKMKTEKECLKRNLEMQRELEREKSEREIWRLHSENWELKKQVEKLTANFDAQTKKIQSLKCGAKKARELEFELECQAQELRKELSEYREGYEHQRKCISKWENVVAVQRTEIENLMNHIRMLTKMDDTVSNLTQSRKSAQKSRSYSPVMSKPRTPVKSKTKGCFYQAAEKEDESCCVCQRHQQPSEGHLGQTYFEGRSSSDSRRTEWCN